MQTLETIRAKSQETLNRWSTKVNAQPDEVKIWGITAGSALVGALTVTAVAKGVVAVISTLASPPVALTVGAVGGGVFSWNYMQGRQTTGESGRSTSAEQVVDPPLEEVPIVTADALNAGTMEVDESIPYMVSAVPAAEQPETTVVGTATAVEPAAAPAEPEVDESIVLDTPPTTTDKVLVEPQATAESTVPSAVEESDTPTPDNLEIISGIGPVYAGRLHAAGIHTFAQLADLTAERIHEIIAPVRSGHMIDAERWLSEARQFAARG